MSTKRTAATSRAKAKKLATVLRSPEDLTHAVSEYALLEMTVESMKLEADAEVKAITERHQKKIEAKLAEMADLLPSIEFYTRAHREDLFKGDAKTARVAGHELCLHMTPPKVETARGVTQKAVLAALIEHEDGEWADTFIRWSEALDKEAILARFNLTTKAWQEGHERLGELGIEITQTEQFTLKTYRVLGDTNTTKGTAEAA